MPFIVNSQKQQYRQKQEEASQCRASDQQTSLSTSCKHKERKQVYPAFCEESFMVKIKDKRFREKYKGAHVTIRCMLFLRRFPSYDRIFSSLSAANILQREVLSLSVSLPQCKGEASPQ